MPEEKLLNQRMDLIVVNRSRRRNCFARDLLANRSYPRLLSGNWCFGKKPKESVHGTTTLGRPIREMKGCRTAGSGAGSQASTGTSSRP